ncbi:MAG: N-acetyltransferase [Candidatus Omnitrophota bacterium]
MIRKATLKDVKGILDLINFYAKKDLMLPRSMNEIYENIRDFFIYEENGVILGCAALHVTWDDLAEVKSLAVDETKKKHKIGTKLIEAIFEDAKKLNIKRVFALTYVPDFFKKLGFKRIEHAELPHKIWSECIKCVKFPDCQETALVKDA